MDEQRDRLCRECPSLPRRVTPGRLRFICPQDAPQLVSSDFARGEAFDRGHLYLLWRQHGANFVLGADNAFVVALIAGAAP